MNYLSDLLGPARAKELTDEINEHVENLKILGYKEQRSWNEFFSGLKPPSAWDLKYLEERIKTNLYYYRSNYLIVCFTIMVINLIVMPFLLVSILIVAVWMFYALIVHKGSIKLGDKSVDSNLKHNIVYVTSAIFMFLTGALYGLLWTVLMCLVACLSHALFRSRSIYSKTSKIEEEIKINMFGSSQGGNLVAEKSSEVLESLNATSRHVIDEINHKDASADIETPQHVEADMQLPSFGAAARKRASSPGLTKND